MYIMCNGSNNVIFFLIFQAMNTMLAFRYIVLFVAIIVVVNAGRRNCKYKILQASIILAVNENNDFRLQKIGW